MNKVNGYCQIDLPDRLNLSALTSTEAKLTKEEARPIIDKLGLGGIKLPEDQEERTHDEIYKMVSDALVRKPAYIVTKRSIYDGITIVPAFIMDEINGGDDISITGYAENLSGPVVISIIIDLNDILDVETTPTIYDLVFSVSAYQITTTQIK